MMGNIFNRFSSGLKELSSRLPSSRAKILHPKKNHEYTLWENPFKAHKILLTLSLLFLPLFIFVFYHIFVSLSRADANRSYDVVVVGGGTGGVSAAIQAARNGASVAVVEETDWVGGQMTAGGVGTLDEGMDWSTNPATGYERNSGIYKEFLDQIIARYGGIQNLHKCYYGNFSICFEPKVGQEILSTMLSQAGVQVFTREKVTSALKSGNTVVGIVAHNNVTNGTDQFNAKVVIDATEYGDVIPLTGAAYRVGRSTSTSIDMNAPIQDITYKAVIKRYDGGIPANLQITTEPPGYQAAKSLFAQYLSPNAPLRDWGNGANPYENPRSWVQYIAYRGIADSTRPSSQTVASYGQAATLTKSGINLSNDYPATVRFLEDPTNRTQVTCEAKLRTIQMLYYIQREMGQSWSIDNDQGFDTSYNQSQNLCASIPTAYKEIEKRMPLIPYVRESRRIIGLSTITSASIKAQKDVNRIDPTAVNTVDDANSIALGGYTTDLHCTNGAPCTQDQFDGSIDNVADLLQDTHSLFQVPMGSLIPQSVDGFLAAEKNISQGRIANGATRLQPITMLTGQAAGALAAIAAKTNRQPRQVGAIEVQRVLLAANDPLTLYKFADTTQGSAFWQGIHLASLYGIMTGNSGNFNTPDALDRGTAAIILTRLLSIATNGTVDDAINQLRSRGITTTATNADFGSSNPLLKGQLALFIARGMGQNVASQSDAFTYLTSQGVSVGCNGGACENDSVSRGQMAESIGTALGKIPNPSGVTTSAQPTPAPTSPPATVATDPAGSLDTLDATGNATGWGCDVDASNHVTDIHFYADGGGFGTFLGIATANQAGTDQALVGLCGGSINHRFSFTLPVSVQDGKSHQIYAYAIGVGGGAAYKALWNAPKTFQNSGGISTPPAQGTKPQLTGWQDYVTATGDLVGWACDKANNANPVRIDIYIDGGGFGQFIGTTTADKPGDDSTALAGLCGGGSGNRRYIFPLPDSLRNAGTHTIYTYAISSGDVDHILIPNSGQPFSLGNKDAYGFADYVDTTGRALGWACDPDDFSQPLRIDFYLDGPAGQGQLIGSATANIPDEKSVGYFCNGFNAHRFAFQLPASALTGDHQLYIYGINIGTGSTTLLSDTAISTSDRRQAPAGL